MASKPGIPTDWPWKPFRNFKWMILTPWIVHSIYSLLVNEAKEKDLGCFLLQEDAELLMRALSLSKLIEKATGMIKSYSMGLFLHRYQQMEFLYYWLHRALHLHFLYSRYHSHHHSSIVNRAYYFCYPPFRGAHCLLFTVCISVVQNSVYQNCLCCLFAGYLFCIDFMNNIGHCNFELIPKAVFTIFPLLKYLMYTPSFHSLHHTQFRTNYSLFMPIYDYIYGTMDKSTDIIYETSLKGQDESPDVVHLTHLTTLDSIYHVCLEQLRRA
ncbi:hypothetical protein L6164_016769 [Bauhinia variegata]|uniref:Uncharacterized protein n=1 Tax=Bauhinia variegata TaxID=167791 RepID=A0ACB9N5L5_BAUVA|nr:hypothetical protein L6164_016769 [Bauhinia variegata]